MPCLAIIVLSIWFMAASCAGGRAVARAWFMRAGNAGGSRPSHQDHSPSQVARTASARRHQCHRFDPVSAPHLQHEPLFRGYGAHVCLSRRLPRRASQGCGSARRLRGGAVPVCAPSDRRATQAPSWQPRRSPRPSPPAATPASQAWRVPAWAPDPRTTGTAARVGTAAPARCGPVRLSPRQRRREARHQPGRHEPGRQKMYALQPAGPRVYVALSLHGGASQPERGEGEGRGHACCVDGAWLKRSCRSTCPRQMRTTSLATYQPTYQATSPSCSRPGKKTSLSAHVPARAATASDPPSVDRTTTSDCRRFIPRTGAIGEETARGAAVGAGGGGLVW